MHSIMMFDTSRLRAKPPSSIMKPACMKNTRNAVTSTHTVFNGLMTSAAFTDAWPSTDAPAWVLKYQPDA